MKVFYKILVSYLLTIAAIVFTSCDYIDKYLSKKDTDGVIVAIEDNYLYDRDIENLVPEGTNSADSALIVDGFIKRWATNVLILANAERNVTNADEINKLVENYKKTLLVHYYQQNMLNEKVEIPTDEEVKEFYNKNENLFNLKYPAVKGIIMSIPKNVEVKQIKKEFKNIEKEIEQVENFAVSYATQYILFNDQWKSLKTIKKNINTTIDIEGAGYYETKDSANTILINITEYIPAGKVAPFEMVIESARQELYNKEKMYYLRNFGKNLYEYALRHDQIKFYTKDRQE